MRVDRFAVVLSLLGAAACSSSPKSFDDLPPELQASTIVSMHDASMPVPDAGTFSWMPGSKVVADASYTSKEVTEINQMIRGALEESLLRRGFYQIPDRGDYLVGYLVASEAALTDQALNRAFGMSGLSDKYPADRKYEQGALVVDILDRKNRVSIWRGSIKVLSDPDLDPAVRKQRVYVLVDRLMARFKAGY